MEIRSPVLRELSERLAVKQPRKAASRKPGGRSPPARRIKLNAARKPNFSGSTARARVIRFIVFVSAPSSRMARPLVKLFRK